MKRSIYFFVIILLCFQSGYAQKTFQAKLFFDKDIDPQKISIHYYNGKNDIFLPDTLTGKIIDIEDEFYSPFAALFINYSGLYRKAFFIKDEPAKISFGISADGKLEYKKIAHAKPLFDSSNEIYRKIIKSKKEAGLSFQKFMEENGSEVFQDDSITHIYYGYIKAMNKASLEVLKRYPDSFFSFWFFRDQIVNTSRIILPKDTAYLKELISCFYDVFPDKFTKSISGRALIEQLKVITAPLKGNIAAPLFSAQDIYGEKINLKDYRGRYVVLDFWATWCPPCMAEMPFLREIRKVIPEDSLAIIGISWDRNLDQLKKVIKEEDLNWAQLYDRDNEITSRYKILSIPHLFLINKEGIIISKNLSEDNWGKWLKTIRED